MTNNDEKNKNNPSDDGIKSLLDHSMQIAAWVDFKSTYNPENFLLLEPDQDITETALFIIKDNTEEIEKLIQNQKIKRVSLESLASLTPQTQIKYVLVQPYTLFQLFNGTT